MLQQVFFYLLRRKFQKISLHARPFATRLQVPHHVDVIRHDDKTIHHHPLVFDQVTQAVDKDVFVFIGYQSLFPGQVAVKKCGYSVMMADMIV